MEDASRDLTELGSVLPVSGHLTGGGKLVAVLQESVEVKDQGLGQGELAKPLGSQDAGQVGQRDEGEKVVGRLDSVEVKEVAQGGAPPRPSHLGPEARGEAHGR